jgi:hypothetical protein
MSAHANLHAKVRQCSLKLCTTSLVIGRSARTVMQFSALLVALCLVLTCSWALQASSFTSTRLVSCFVAAPPSPRCVHARHGGADRLHAR